MDKGLSIKLKGEQMRDFKLMHFIAFETRRVLLNTDKFVTKRFSARDKEIIEYLKQKNPYALGDALFRTASGKNAELVYCYRNFRYTQDLENDMLTVREIYILPDNTWVLRGHEGPMVKPKKTKYVEVSADSIKESFKQEIRRSDDVWTRQELYEKIKQYFGDGPHSLRHET